MNVLIVYWHPEPNSFNGAMFRRAIESFEAAGHEVKTSDLHEMNFNPVSDDIISPMLTTLSSSNSN
ncbi:NAD(P)H-dependent oxidoreductase [Vibrio maritimus]|uniref:NAD(P)H-dependent oxidoreductase n=1 Tax=Vibrio maritimus TaxID=990268 RepID=UPI0022796093|nr:NAD(P)H-dependent oxidoreductase [Vibrio maritimus]